jgi:hypothetical protein
VEDRPWGGSSQTAMNAALKVTVHRVRRRQTQVGDHESADRRARDQGGLKQHDVQRERSRQPVHADKVRDDRGTGGSIDGAHQRCQGDHRIDLQERRMADEGAQREQSRAGGEAELGHDQHPAAVEAIGDRAAPE